MGLENEIDTLLARLFGSDILAEPNAQKLAERVLAASFGREQLQAVHQLVSAKSVLVEGKQVPAVLELAVSGSKDAMGLMTQLHGNEPAGLAAIAFAMLLWRKGLLDATVYCIIGTPLAAKQYFEAWAKAPHDIQETRDAFRRGYGADGELLRDPNRIPADYKEKQDDPHNARALALETLADRFTVTLDIHSARGDLVCVTEYTELKHLLHSPIRNILAELASNIGSHAAAVTFKTLLLKKPGIRALTGIEAGRHEDPAAPARAIAFTHALMFNLGLTKLPPAPTYMKNETGELDVFQVGGSLNFSQLEKFGHPQPSDVYYTVKAGIGTTSDEVIVREGNLYAMKKRIDAEPASIAFCVHQYEELEKIEAGQIVAVAVPSGAQLKAPSVMYGLFVAKSAKLYTDKAAGVLPVAASALEQKFCYPCTKRTVKA